MKEICQKFHIKRPNYFGWDINHRYKTSDKNVFFNSVCSETITNTIPEVFVADWLLEDIENGCQLMINIDTLKSIKMYNKSA